MFVQVKFVLNMALVLKNIEALVLEISLIHLSAIHWLTWVFFFNHLSHVCFIQEGEAYISLTIQRKRLCPLFITTRRFTLQTLQYTNKCTSSECFPAIPALPPTTLIIKHWVCRAAQKSFATLAMLLIKIIICVKTLKLFFFLNINSYHRHVTTAITKNAGSYAILLGNLMTVTYSQGRVKVVVFALLYIYGPT